MADSHTEKDLGRLTSFFDEASNGNYLFCAHLGDLAETQPEYYSAVDNLIEENYSHLNFYPMVGNHDITRMARIRLRESSTSHSTPLANGIIPPEAKWRKSSAKPMEKSCMS